MPTYCEVACAQPQKSYCWSFTIVNAFAASEKRKIKGGIVKDSERKHSVLAKGEGKKDTFVKYPTHEGDKTGRYSSSM